MSNSVNLIGHVGARLDLQMRHGGVLGPVVMDFANDDGTVVSFTDNVDTAVRAKARLRSAPYTQFDLVAAVDATPGRIVVSIAKAVAESLPKPVTVTSPPQELDWTLEVNWGDSLPDTPLFYGALRVHANATEAA